MRALAVSCVSFCVSTLACGSSPPPAPSAPPAPTASSAAQPSEDAKKAEDTAAKQAAAIDALTQDEAKKSLCDPDHKAALEKLASDIEATMKAKKADDGTPLGMQTVGTKVIALSDTPRSVTMSVTGRGTEVHVLAMGAREVSMDVLAGGVAATTMRSPFQKSATSSPPKLELPKIGTLTELQGDSRLIQIKPGQPLEVKMRGQGCALVAVFQKL
jgi:hypothetical protein